MSKPSRVLPELTDKQKDLFWAKVAKGDDPRGCWLWTAYRLPGGYGRWGTHKDGLFYVHRVAYHLSGWIVPEGLTLDHLCRNRACCNPAHLEPVTNRENILRGNGPSARGARSACCLKCGGPYSFRKTGRVCLACVRDGARRYRRAAMQQRAGAGAEGI